MTSTVQILIGMLLINGLISQDLYHWFPAPYLTFFLCSLLSMVCLLGDYILVKLSGIQENGNILRAVTDSTTHASVGALVWAVAEGYEFLGEKKKWLNVLFCAFLAASVDLDHFMAAGSLDLKKALHLQHRPPFHITSLIPAVVFLCWIIGYYRPSMKVFSLMFLASWLSHHLRDANHRGLWLAPFGHTPVFPSVVYIFLIVVLSLIVRICYCHLQTNTVHTSIFQIV
ncbi:transmembrane protein 267-like isoform X2 [Biomphalaria glabrata]|uniref:Transmembrane protein 267 n=1 Tax=Biomphalaria glabrata TaxID=6526 RepID=A0A9W3B8A2_BIOGL|nr:transmembrane protein 267-like isoform X2 [Biomphalaria glabrata]